MAGTKNLYLIIQEFKISELEKEVKEGEKRDAVDSADTRAAQRDLRRLQVPVRISRQLFFVRNILENSTYKFSASRYCEDFA
jgi:hypothetical protein